MQAGFEEMKLLALRYYEGVETNWLAEQAGSEPVTIFNRLRRLEAAVLCEYSLTVVRTVAADAHQTLRVLV